MAVRTNIVPVGFEVLTVGSSPTGMNSVPGEACVAVLSVEGSNIRFKTSEAATSTEGHKLAIGAFLTLDSHDQIICFNAVRDGLVDAVLQVEYYK